MNKLDKGQPAEKPLQIRTRWLGDLDALRKEFPFLAEPVKVQRVSDYAPERIYASPEEFAKVLGGMAKTLDYGNFKGFMDDVGRFRKNGLAGALHRIWGVVASAANEHGF